MQDVGSAFNGYGNEFRLISYKTRQVQEKTGVALGGDGKGDAVVHQQLYKSTDFRPQLRNRLAGIGYVGDGNSWA